MPIPFAINGLGRIGRALLRIATRRPDLELVAVNDVAGAEQLAGLLRHDSLHGPYPGAVEAADGELTLDGRRIAVFRQPSIEAIPWQETEARLVVDATGRCTTRRRALAHLRPPVEKVIVSANASGMDRTLCIGINDGDYDPRAHHLLSAASCTTNCLVPVAWVLDRAFGLAAGMLNTVHSYNNDQRLLEGPHRDRRRARAAALNMIPTTTSAVEAAVRILPALEGKIAGFAVRVPTPNVSLIDFVARLEEAPPVDELERAFRRAASDELAGILGVSDEELVSTDFLRDPRSAVVDLPLLQSAAGLVRVVAWYDNEWGHASRLTDLLELAGSHLHEAAPDPAPRGGEA